MKMLLYNFISCCGYTLASIALCSMRVVVYKNALKLFLRFSQQYDVAQLRYLGFIYKKMLRITMEVHADRQTDG